MIWERSELGGSLAKSSGTTRDSLARRHFDIVMHVTVSQWGPVFLLIVSPYFFFETGSLFSHWTWSLPVQLDWLAKGSILLCLHTRTGVRDASHHTRLSHVFWGL